MIVDSKLVETYCAIPIRLVQTTNGQAWLQWQRHELKYSLPVTTFVEAIAKTRQMIDAVLTLEACYEWPTTPAARRSATRSLVSR